MLCGTWLTCKSVARQSGHRVAQFPDRSFNIPEQPFRCRICAVRAAGARNCAHSRTRPARRMRGCRRTSLEELGSPLPIAFSIRLNSARRTGTKPAGVRMYVFQHTVHLLANDVAQTLQLLPLLTAECTFYCLYLNRCRLLRCRNP